MERSPSIRHKVKQVKSSLDDLQNVLVDDNYSDDSLLRLSRALKDINDEVDMLTTVMQIGRIKSIS
ncbi:MAG: hypothetical protein KC484_11220 [Colwelliaceae bacterium]|jgi:hypothetical protein|nr:hypothetical protein [Colwelliaceae bacterium]